MSEAYALNAGEGPTYAFGPDFVIKAGERQSTNGAAFVELVTKRGEEPGDHVHPSEDEMFYIVQGAVTFRCGDRSFDLDEGGFVFLPRGVQHGYTLRSDGLVRLIIVTSPPREAAGEGWSGLIGDLESADAG